MPEVSQLDLSYNRLQDIQQLQHLSSLCHVSLAHNHVRTLSALHTRLGNVKKLCFAANKLDSLAGKCGRDVYFCTVGAGDLVGKGVRPSHFD